MSTAVLNPPPAAQVGSDSPGFVPVCREDEVPLGLGRAFIIGEAPVAVFRMRSGGVVAVENRCPHKGGPLHDGMIAGRQIVCPMHAYRFDALTGECDQGTVCSIATYPVEIRRGVVFVSIAPTEK